MQALNTMVLGLMGIYLVSALVSWFLRFRRGRFSLRLTSAFLILAAGAHTLAIVFWSWKTGHVPLSNFCEFLFLFSWGWFAGFLWMRPRFHFSGFEWLAALINAGILFGVLRFNFQPFSLSHRLQSPWLWIHVGSCVLAYAALALSFGGAVMRFILKADHPQIPLWDQATAACVRFGFFFLTLGIASGSVWAESAWGSWWSWDPKETWALATWLIYLIYLHVRHLPGCQGKRLAWVAVAAFFCVLFTWFGVSFLLPGMHSYV